MLNQNHTELEQMSSYTKSLKSMREGEIYPSPFYDIASSYFPTDIKELFRFIKYILSTNELVNVAVDKLASYPITDFVYYKTKYEAKPFQLGDLSQLPAVDKWKTMLEVDLSLKSKLKAIGKAYLGYGNVFTSLYVPFTRILTCDSCKAITQIRGNEFKYDQTRKEFQAKCGSCGKVGTNIVDKARKDTKGCNIILWDPSRIDLVYHPLSDTSDIFYTISHEERKIIKKWADGDFLAKTPLGFIEACFQQRDAGRIKFNPGMVMHLKREFMPGIFPGWGWPLPAVILKQAFYLQLLRKANETIFEQHILPFIALFPQATQGLDVYKQINLGDWKHEVERQMTEWRQDPAKVGIFPSPIGQQVIGGQGKAFELTQEANNIADAIIVGMGIPREFIFGGMSWSASSVSVRIIENDMLNFREEMLNFPNHFLVPKLSGISGLEPIHVGLQDFKMADDLQQQQLMFQMMANRVISKDTFFKDCGYKLDYATEQNLIDNEIDDEIKIQEKLAMSNAKIQGASELTLAQYGMFSQGMQQDESKLMDIPTMPPEPPPPPPNEQLLQAHQMLSEMFSSDDMAHLLRVKSWQLENLVRDGKIPPEAAHAVQLIKDGGGQGNQIVGDSTVIPGQPMPDQPMPGMMPGQPMPDQPMLPDGQPLPQQPVTGTPEAINAQETGTPSQIPVAPDYLPDDIITVLQSIPEAVLLELIKQEPKDLKAAGRDGSLAPTIADAILHLQKKIKENDPANPTGGVRAKKMEHMPQTMNKQMLDQLVVMPVGEILHLADKEGLAPDAVTFILGKKLAGYVPAAPQPPVEPVAPTAPQAQEPPPLPMGQEDLNNLLQIPPQELQQLYASGQIPPEVYEFVMRHQQVPHMQPMQAALPPEPPAAPPPQAHPVSPGAMPGELQDTQELPPGQPQVPPEFMSPSGVPYSAKELLKSGIPPAILLEVGYSPEDLGEAGVSPAAGAKTDNVHADVLNILSMLQTLTPTQQQTLLMQLSQVNPELADRVMVKMSSNTLSSNKPGITKNGSSKLGVNKTALNPFDILSAPPSANNVMGFGTDMESPWVKQPPAYKALKKLLNDFSSQQLRNTTSNVNNPGLTPPSEVNSNNKINK